MSAACDRLSMSLSARDATAAAAAASPLGPAPVSASSLRARFLGAITNPCVPVAAAAASTCLPCYARAAASSSSQQQQPQQQPRPPLFSLWRSRSNWCVTAWPAACSSRRWLLCRVRSAREEARARAGRPCRRSPRLTAAPRSRHVSWVKAAAVLYSADQYSRTVHREGRWRAARGRRASSRAAGMPRA
eukprot:214880-Chlamydomonas_euryale.AAC.6